MQIVPMRDLKNTVKIERRCDESNEPVWLIKVSLIIKMVK